MSYTCFVCGWFGGALIGYTPWREQACFKCYWWAWNLWGFPVAYEQVELLLGCGSTRDMRISVNGLRDWTELVTVDNNPDHKPDHVHDLEVLPWPFEDDSFDQIHGYEILEHLGRQGDFRSFFAHFYEAWRILRPGGFLAVTCPSYKGLWAWGDPSHTRVINSGSLVFLDQEEYRKQVGRTAMSDFRWLWKGDFRTVSLDTKAEEAGTGFAFVLQAVKPSRGSDAV